VTRSVGRGSLDFARDDTHYKNAKICSMCRHSVATLQLRGIYGVGDAKLESFA